MKIIDLLNKIANGEEVPNVIKFNDIIYKKADVGEDYYNFTIHKWFFKDVFDASGVNLEVEILEEEKKIPEKEDELIRYNIQEFDNLKEFVEITTNDVFGKINEIINKQNKIIDYLDYLKSKGE